ncbi:hypothetical protein [Ornithinimicrobium faecis]|uniref:hypothetical protein n=1 Tax=Ornithinimicrobium faecis TaxID=2934158 RepID=UPI002119939F|nr:hypothetical protein [Ornithinimicrobium sp. HY1745]
MSTFEVDARAIDSAGATLRGTAEEMRQAADRIGRALQLAGGAGGSGALAASGAAAARQWRDGLQTYAEAGAALSRATEQAALAYRMVELQTSMALTPVVAP